MNFAILGDERGLKSLNSKAISYPEGAYNTEIDLRGYLYLMKKAVIHLAIENCRSNPTKGSKSPIP